MRYMFRRFAACLMSLMLAFSWTAAQAEQEPLLPDLDKLEALLDSFTDVMYGQEFTGFRADASDQAPQVVYGLMWRLLYRGLLPYTPVDGVITLTQAQLESLYGQLFAQGSFILPQEDCCDMITRTADGMAFDVSTAGSGMAGMQIMLASGDESTQTQQLMLELYHIDEDYYLRNEESLLNANWYGSALAEVIRDEYAPFGWKLVSWGSADDLEDGSLDRSSDMPELREYINERLGFSVMYPALIPQESLKETETGVQAQSADGKLTFSVNISDTPDATLESTLEAMLKPEDSVVETYPEQQYFTLSFTQNGQVTTQMVLVAGGKTATASLTYPADEMETYAVYASCMVNSFALTALSVG